MRTLGTDEDDAHAHRAHPARRAGVGAPSGSSADPSGTRGSPRRGGARQSGSPSGWRRPGSSASATALYASTLPRAIETAQLLAPALGGLEVRVRHELREHDPGALDGLLWSDAIATHQLPEFDHEPDRPIADGGESLRGFHLRARFALEALAASHHGETVVVVCHGGVVAAGVGLVFSVPADQRLFLPTRYVSMTELEVTERGWRLGRYNDRYPVTDD